MTDETCRWCHCDIEEDEGAYCSDVCEEAHTNELIASGLSAEEIEEETAW